MMRSTVVTRSWTLKVHPLGKRLEEDHPVLNAQLADGSRLAVGIPPVVQPAPALTIRKVEYLSHSKSNPAAFRLDFADSEGAHFTGPNHPRKAIESARIPSRIGHGFCTNWPTENIAIKPTRASAESRSDNPNRLLLRRDNRCFIGSVMA
jgi:hypothetical protein